MATPRKTPRQQRRFELAVERLWDDFKTPAICAALDRQRFQPLAHLEGIWREKLADYNRDPRHQPLTTWTKLYEVRMFRRGISQVFRHAVAKVRSAETPRKQKNIEAVVAEMLADEKSKQEREAKRERRLAMLYNMPGWH